MWDDVVVVFVVVGLVLTSSLRTLTSTSVADIPGLGRAAKLQREPPSLNGRYPGSARLYHRRQQL
jgi:hypothetical protein